MTSRSDKGASEGYFCPVSVAGPKLQSIRVTLFEENSFRLDVRDAVSVRHITQGEQNLFYLSLFDDEIDARLEEFLAAGFCAIWTEATLTAAALGSNQPMLS